MHHRPCPGFEPDSSPVAARLTDLAIAAAFAGGLGVGGELDGFLARATELLGDEADRLDRDGALLVAQALAGGVAEVPGQSLDAGRTPRAA